MLGKNARKLDRSNTSSPDVFSVSPPVVGIRSGERENTTMIEALLLAVAGGMFSYAAWLTLHYLKSISKDIAAIREMLAQNRRERARAEP